MHLILENVMKQLLELWSGSYKSQIRQGSGKSKAGDAYVISKKGWDEMDAMAKHSTKLIPSWMCRSILSVSSRWRWTAETHLFFLISLGPILLKEHLPTPYFQHFIDLPEITKVLIEPKINVNDLASVDQKLQDWVSKFDEYVCSASVSASYG
jgi:hypothetical protein